MLYTVVVIQFMLFCTVAELIDWVIVLYYFRISVWHLCIKRLLTYLLSTCHKAEFIPSHRVNRPVIEQAFEVLEQRVLVLVNESNDAVRHLTGVVQHAEVTTELQRLLW